MAVAPAPNRLVLVLVVAAIVVSAGCGALGATSGTSQEPGGNTVTVEPGEFPAPPTSLTEAGAAETAAYHHLALVNERLDLAQPSGETSVPALDSVTTDTVERRSGGYYVSVTLSVPASDTVSVPELDRAIYLVRENVTPTPAYPIQTRPAGGSPGSGSASGVDIQGANFAPNRTNISVVVTSLDGSPSTEFVSTLDLPSEEVVVVEDAIDSPGRYRVTVYTANASRSGTVSVTEDSTETPVGVFVGPEGSLEIYQGPG